MSAAANRPSTDERSFRERMRAWAQPPRELVMTTSGKFLCLITLGVGFGAVNTGNNLLFLLLGMLLALILASGILSEAVVMRLSAKRRVPSRLVAGSAAKGAYVVTNPRAWASISVELSDRNALVTAGPGIGSKTGPETIPWWKVWRKAPEELPAGGAYLLRLEGGEEVDADARFTFERRGRYQLQTMRITTRFPFGLFEKSRTLQEPAEVTVYPAGLPAQDWVATVRGRFGEVATNKRGPGEDFYGLRDYRQGDDRRMIHWKSTARRGQTVVRETEALTQREVSVLFCDWAAHPVPSTVFEEAVSKTAGLLTSLLEDGWRVGLVTREGDIPPAGGGQHLDRMLAELAVVRHHREPFVPDDIGGSLIVIGGDGVSGDVNIPFGGVHA